MNVATYNNAKRLTAYRYKHHSDLHGPFYVRLIDLKGGSWAIQEGFPQLAPKPGDDSSSDSPGDDSGDEPPSKKAKGGKPGASSKADAKKPKAADKPENDEEQQPAKKRERKAARK